MNNIEYPLMNISSTLCLPFIYYLSMPLISFIFDGKSNNCAGKTPAGYKVVASLAGNCVLIVCLLVLMNKMNIGHVGCFAPSEDSINIGFLLSPANCKVSCADKGYRYALVLFLNSSNNYIDLQQ